MKYWVALLIVLVVGCTVEQGPIIQQTTSFPDSSTQKHGSPVEKENVVQKEVLKNNTTRPIENETRSEPTMQIYLDLIEDDSKNIEAEKFWDVYLPLYEGEYEVHIQFEDDTLVDEAFRCAKSKVSSSTFHSIVEDVFDSDMRLDTVRLRLLEDGVDIYNQHVLMEEQTKNIQGKNVEFVSAFRDDAVVRVGRHVKKIREANEKQIGGLSLYPHVIHGDPALTEFWVDSCLFEAFPSEKGEEIVIESKKVSFTDFEIRNKKTVLK